MADEYIRRSDAIEEIDKWLDAVGTALVGKGLSYYGELIGCIEDAPAADVAPVVRGKPITKIREVTITEYHEARGMFAVDGSNVYIKNMVHTEIPYDYCPVCGAVLCSRWHNYCGKCGAKMDGGNEGEREL